MKKSILRAQALAACTLFVLSAVPCLAPASAQEAPAPAGAEAGPVHTVAEGTQIIDAAQLQSAGGLSVLAGATAVIDFASAANLVLPGNFVNAGTVYAASSSAGVATAALTANNIYNQSGALLTTVLPANGIAGFTSALSSLNLNLTAVQDIINQGVISSAGNLTMQAGGSIVNAGTMSAALSASLASATGSITNSGVIAATTGSINIASQMAQALAINNVNGTLAALNGSFNASTASLAELGVKPTLTVTGGDLLARELNFTSGEGVVNVNSNTMEGRVNISGGEAHITAATPNLIVGEMNLTGDPTYWNAGDGSSPGVITIGSSLVLGSVNLTFAASGDIVSGAGAGALDVSSLGPTCCNAGSILMIAGANFTSPATGSGSNDGSTQLVLSGASQWGGQIDLTGGGNNPITSFTTAGNGAGGNVTLAAFYGTSTPGPSSGTVTLPANVTINTYSTQLSAFGTNGNVTIIAGAPSGTTIQTGGIATSGISATEGNTLNPQAANNGMVTIASATPQFWGNPGALASGVNMVGGAPFNATTFTVNDASNLSGQTIAINPLGPNFELATVSSVSGSTVTLNAPLVNNHTTNEAIYVAASSLTIQPPGTVGPVTNGLPMTQNGGIIVSGAAQSGNIVVGGSIQANNAINITTNQSASSGNGQVQINGNLSLAMNPTAQTSPVLQWQSYPTINITGRTVTVPSAVTVSSQISNCNLCPNIINITAQTLTNNGTITGGAPGSSPYSNAYINVQSPASLFVSGSGTFSVPGASVIEIAAADNATLHIQSSLNLQTGGNGLVILNAQGANGEINVSQAVSMSGGPVVSINSPTINLSGTANLSGDSGTVFSITSGYTLGDDLTINVGGLLGGTATITAPGGAIFIRPAEGKSIHINASNPSQLVFSGAVATFATTGNGTTQISSNVTIGSGTAQSIVNPSGAILGTAFQPYVGGPLATAGDFVAFAGYPYHVVLALMAPVIASGQFHYLSTYTQQGSAVYVIPAARQVGLRVSAGIFVVIQSDGTIAPADQATINSDTQLVGIAAANNGNLTDIVVGNEDIVGGATPGPSITTLTGLINSTKTLRSSITNPVTGQPYNSTNLPVTTRQKSGVLNLVTDHASMVTLVQSVEQYIYGNFYPFFDESPGGVVQTLVQNPGISQSAFQTLVQNYMNSNFDTAANNFKTYVVTQIPDIRVGETGWATELVGFTGTGLPQQSTTWATWYYPAMQNWSLTHLNPITNTEGVTIGGYFDSYNEPWKGINGGPPGGAGAPPASLLNAASAQATTINTCCYATFPTLTPMSVLINANGPTQEVQNILSISGSTLTISPLVNNHNAGESVSAGTPQEPFFGIWVASGTNLSDGSLYSLQSITQKYSLPIYPVGQPSGGGGQAISVAGGATGPNLFAEALAASIAQANSTALTNVQLSSRIATDITPYYPAGMENEESETLAQAPSGLPGAAGGGQMDAGYFDGHSFSGGQPPRAGLRSNQIIGLSSGEYECVELESRVPLSADEAAAGQEAQAEPETFDQPGAGKIIALDLGQKAHHPALKAVDVGHDMTENYLPLMSGNIVLAPAEDVAVGVGDGVAHIARGSTVFIAKSSRGTAIHNLQDSRRGAVQIVTGKKVYTLLPGQALVLTRETGSDFAAANPAFGIAYRSVADRGTDDGVKAFSASFSIASALTKVRPLAELVASEEPAKKAAARKLLKNAVLLTELTGAAGPYKTMR